MNDSTSESFVTGKIKEMHLVNFMTYEVINFHPKEYLNVILGPNGTGKSTLVSAILIGMGGDFQKIGRATHLKDYIKHGQESASIEITLFQNEDRETITFCRNISVNGRSEYRLNNRRLDQERYMATVRRFNIQVDNLCQFLPQDRVQDFALMNPHEILKNTQMSVLPPRVSQQFDKLLEYESFEKNVFDKAAKLEEQITSEESTNERLKPVVERMEQRNFITDRLKVANMKQKWLKKLQYEAELQTNQRDLEMAKSTMTERASALGPLQTTAARVFKSRAEDQKQIDEAKRKTEMAKVELRQMQNQAERVESSMVDASNEYSVKVAEIENRKDEEKSLQRDHTKMERELARMESDFEAEQERVDEGQLAGQLAEWRGQREALMSQRHDLDERLDEVVKPQLVQLERRINNMRSLGDQRMQALRGLDEKVYEAVRWLREHRNDPCFEGHVYEPIILELNVKKREHMMYFENMISRNDFFAFTCERTNDTVTLHRKLTELGLPVNVLYSAASSRLQHEPHEPIQNYAHLGIHSYLLQLADAPIPILNYLCKMYGLHRIPVGDQRATAHLAQIQSQMPHPVIFVGNMRLYSKKSVYSSDVVRGTDQISSRNYLAVGVDEAVVVEQEKELRKVRQERDMLRNKRTELETQMEFMEEKERVCKSQQMQLAEKRKQVRAKRTQLKNLAGKINHLQALPTSIVEQEANHKRFMQSNMRKLMENGAQQAVKLSSVMENVHRVRVMQKKLIFRDRQTTELKRELEAAKNRLDEAKKMYETIENSLRELKAQIRSFQSQFEQMAQVASPDLRTFHHRRTFRELPESMEELAEQIVLMRTQVECMNQDDESLFVQYENRRKLIIELKESLAEQRDRRANVSKDIERLRDEWLPAVQAMVVQVNANFRRFMNIIDVVGEVELISNPDNRFSDFGIGIRVQYHDNGPFRILDRYHHSGGERAVAIATYTLALQKISQVPFRCVDEINQGMDPDNERRVFNMLVEEAAQPGRAQYFFVSPKFQPDVATNRYTTFHIIDSGKYLADTDVFNSSSGMLVE